MLRYRLSWEHSLWIKGILVFNVHSTGIKMSTKLPRDIMIDYDFSTCYEYLAFDDFFKLDFITKFNVSSSHNDTDGLSIYMHFDRFFSPVDFACVSKLMAIKWLWLHTCLFHFDILSLFWILDLNCRQWKIRIVWDHNLAIIPSTIFVATQLTLCHSIHSTAQYSIHWSSDPLSMAESRKALTIKSV